MMIKTLNQGELAEIFKCSPEDVFHIAHHVQLGDCAEPSRPHHNPDRVMTASNIIDLSKTFKSMGIRTLATVLCDRTESISNKEAGLHPWLMKNADQIRQGYEGSAFAGYVDNDLRNRPVQILEGFNASRCILDTALDEGRPKNATSIIVIDGVDNGVIIEDGGYFLTKSQALHKMQEAGWRMAYSGDIKVAAQRQFL